ncbi:MAG: amino acid adenylation domain-containing protein [Rhodocyclaceae bacterium]|nr:amino acid adenylation domain-containing protein [Rhodocyclaceae bacterium]
MTSSMPRSRPNSHKRACPCARCTKSAALLPAPSSSWGAMADWRTNLTRSQQLVWLGQQQYPAAPLYNMALTFELNGNLDAACFELAFRACVAECDALRSIFESQAGQPRRRVLERVEFAFPRVDLRRQEDPRSACHDWLAERMRQPFDLGRRAFDTALLQLADDHFVWFLNQHHIISDGRSVGLIFDAIAARYAGLVGRPNAAPAAPIAAFEDYAAHEHRLDQEGRNRQEKAYWAARAQAWQSREALSFYGNPPRHPTTASERVPVVIGITREEKLRRLAASDEFAAVTSDAALFQILQTVFFAYLYRASGQRSLTVGVPSANRAGRRHRNTIGLLMQLFSLQLEVEDGETFASLHDKVRTETLEFLRHAAPGASTPAAAAAFNVVFNYIPIAGSTIAGVAARQRFHHAGHGEAHHLLRLQVQDYDGAELEAALDLNRAAFGSVDAATVAGHFLVMLDAFLDDRSMQLDAVDMLAPRERRLLLEEFNRTGADYDAASRLEARFEAAAAAGPERPAVVAEHAALSYGALDRRADTLAAALTEAGVIDGQIVGLQLDRGIDFVVGVLAVLKAGAVFMPLPSDLPPARRNTMLDLAGAEVVIVADATPADAVPERRSVVRMGAAECSACGLPERARSGSNAAAYVLFTSGSSGEPKGVVCSHRAVANLLADFERRHRLSGSARCSWWTSPSFDVSIYELFSALAFGRTLYVAPEPVRADARRMLDWLCEQGIHSAYLPPFMLNDVREQIELRKARPVLRRLLVGVEPIDEPCLAAMATALPELCIINGYGPTEATVCATLYPVAPGPAPERNTPIGRPVGNNRVYLLDDARRVVPFGAVGEIYIGGDGLSLGYLNRPGETAERFVPSPVEQDRGALLYRTGDLARYLPDGNLMFVGRADDQIKFRGQRIEPGEVERALGQHPDVREALVMARPIDGETRLVAYLATGHGGRRSASEWARWLATRLPRALVPTVFIEIEAFPLTVSGKIDRRALPQAPSGESRHAAAGRPAGTTLEKQLAALFGDVLEMTQVDIGTHFLDMGGDSIRAMLIAARANELGLTLAPREIFEHGTVESLARAIEARGSVRECGDASPASGLTEAELQQVLTEFGEDPDIDDAP